MYVLWWNGGDTRIMNNFYTYIYLDPRKPGKFTYGNFATFFYEPFYVGKGTGKRYLHHIKEKNSTNKHKFNKIQILKEKYDIESYILKIINNNHECCNCFEKFLIKLIGRNDLNEGTLTNLTDGGEGSLNLIQTNDKRNKISIANKGKIISSEQRKLISEVNKKRIYTEEHRRKIGEANSKRIVKEETKEKIRQAHLNRPKKIKQNTILKPKVVIGSWLIGRKHSEETKLKMSLSAKGRISKNKGKKYTDEEKKIIYASRRRPKTKEEKRKNSEALKKYACNRPKSHNENISKSLKERFKNGTITTS